VIKTILFDLGNVIFTGDIKMTGGTVTINARYSGGTYDDQSNPSSNLTMSCASPGTGSPCLTQSSDNAAFVYFTSGGLNFTGGNFHANHTAIIMSTASGQVKVTGGAPPSWTAPTEGPFAALAPELDWTTLPAVQPLQLAVGGHRRILPGTHPASHNRVLFCDPPAPYSQR
jgi:hypothetical protein